MVHVHMINSFVIQYFTITATYLFLVGLDYGITIIILAISHLSRDDQFQMWIDFSKSPMKHALPMIVFKFSLFTLRDVLLFWLLILSTGCLQKTVLIVS